MSAPQGDSSPPIVTYEPPFAQHRFHARVRLAMLCGLAPLLPLFVTIVESIALHDRRWLVAAIAVLILAHGVVGFGFFVICMEYAVQKGRHLSLQQFLRESATALIALVANWPLFVAIVFIAWQWK